MTPFTERKRLSLARGPTGVPLNGKLGGWAGGGGLMSCSYMRYA